ncbi:hypothetical protein QEN19_003013 [Hanseniaspora menglaensis]
MLVKLRLGYIKRRMKITSLWSKIKISKRGISSSSNLNNDQTAGENTSIIVTESSTTSTIKENHLLASIGAKSLKKNNKENNKLYRNFPASWNINQKNNKQVLYWKSIPSERIGIKEYSYNISPRQYMANEPKYVTKQEKEINQKKQAILISSSSPYNGSPLKDTWNKYLTKEYGAPLNYDLGEKGRFIMATIGTLYTLAKQKPQYFDIPYLGGNIKHPHDILNRANMRLLSGEKGTSLNGINFDIDWRHLPKEWVEGNSRLFFAKPTEHIVQNEEIATQRDIDTSMLLDKRSSNKPESNDLSVFSNNIADILRHHNKEMEKKKNITGRKRNKLNKKRN